MPHPPLYKEGWGYSKRGVKGNSMANRGNSFNIPGATATPRAHPPIVCSDSTNLPQTSNIAR